MPVILLTLIFITMVSVGMLALGPMTQKGKTIETHKIQDDAIHSIIGWSVANNRIPDTSTGVTGFAHVVGDSDDAWGTPLVYIAADNLLNPTPPAICSRKTTNLRVTPVTNDIAFVVLSSGSDYTVNSTPNASQALNGTVTVSANDLVKWVTLEELKNKAGCYASTQGRLKILNNELPTACIGQPYNATIFSDGGVPPYSNWTASSLPTGLVINSINGRITGTPTGTVQTFNISFSRTDSDNTTVQKTLPLKLISCNAPPACTLSANPTEVLKGSASTLAWTVTNGPVDGSFSPPSGACITFSSSSGGSCTTARLTASIQTGFALNVTNTDGSSNCSTGVYTAYRVWNDTGARLDFSVDGTCMRVNRNNEITSDPLLLSYGETISQYGSNDGTCSGGVIGQISYAAAAAADINNNSRVEFSGTDR